MEWVAETVLLREAQKLASAVEEKDATIALMNNDLQDRDNQIQAIQYENVTLQEQRDVYQAELEKCQDTIKHLKIRYVPHARDPGSSGKQSDPGHFLKVSRQIFFVISMYPFFTYF